MSNKTQVEFLEEILKLKKENPDFEIHFCVASEEVVEFEKWTQHEITRVEILPWLENGEKIFINEKDIRDFFVGESDFDCWSKEELDKVVTDRYDAAVKMAICVFTNAD